MRALALAVAALVLAAPALAGGRPNAAAIETKLVCPVCHETLDQSTAPVAQEMKALIRKRIAQGWTEKQILDEMVANFGPGRALDTREARVRPARLGAAARRGARRRRRPRRSARATGRGRPPGPAQPELPGLDPEIERRIDEELDRLDD